MKLYYPTQFLLAIYSISKSIITEKSKEQKQRLGPSHSLVSQRDSVMNTALAG